MVDTSCQTRAAAEHAAVLDPDGYAFVSSLNAYRDWPPGPLRGEDEPTWDTDDDEYGPVKAHAERVLGAASGDRFLTARAGLVAGPHDRLHRLGWWLERIAAGGRVVVPDALDQPIALVDVRDLAGWLVQVCGRVSGPVNATGPAGMTTLAGCWRPAGGHRRRRRVGGRGRGGAAGRRRAALAAPAVLAPGRRRGHRLGRRHHPGPGARLPSRPLRGTVADTWAWQRAADRPEPPPGRTLPGLPPDLEAQLLAAHRPG